MKATFLARDSILDEAQAGALLLTVNKRLARQLRQAFDERMEQEGRLAWRTPEILSLDAWLKRTFTSFAEGWQFLGRFPALYLWERIIEEDIKVTGNDLLHTAKTAVQAAEAHQLLQDHGLEVETSNLTADQKAFCRWRRAYINKCAADRWVDTAGLLDFILPRIRDKQSVFPDNVLFVGFDDISPQLVALSQELMLACDGEARFISVLGETGILSMLSCQDRQAEVRAAALWARELLAAGETQIGVVVPDLPRYQRLIERIFTAEVDPRSLMDPGMEEGSFTLSLGDRASHKGLIFSALKILEPALRLSMDDASFLLRTPYLWGSQQEVFTRSRCEQGLRFLRKTEFSLARLESYCRSQTFSPCPHMADIWKTLREFRGEKLRQLPGAWATTFSRLLTAVGWPGERSLNSEDYQLYKAWQEKILPQLACLDGVSSPMLYGQAFNLLRRIASETVFQPEGPQSPLQIMGLLESAGLQFNHLWVMGLDEGSLPARARPNPFLPITLQVVHQMPHSSSERELDYANRVCSRLFQSAPHITLSYPQWEGDCLLRPSPFVAMVPPTNFPTVLSQDPVNVLHSAGIDLETLVDQTGPPLSEDEDVSGGTNLLRDQALCPFRAFAHHRLRIKVPQAGTLGVDAGTRGNLLHAVLEKFWSITCDHAGLVALSLEELSRRVETCVQEAASRFFPENDLDIPLFVQNLEKERVKRLVLLWLTDVEMSRVPFSVMAVESRQVVPVGPLSLEVRADRVDRLNNDSLVIIDYKTGRPELNGLLDRPLLEPQLAIYGLNSEKDSLDGVAFAILRSDECAFKGISRNEGILPRVESVGNCKSLIRQGVSDWNQLLQRWFEDLESFARDFAAGEAPVRPVHRIKACRYCDLHPLCRILEQDHTEEDVD
ncbi:PD-(D/E)XK nuclease family protein [Desulfuromonas sp. AOP6]|uniref:PD-(D/E)XK nuclease family protein n=1 Tax=Desulfuromonas sp. AOP6 TaxID=1566351 RepID=UPI00127B346F|nr:PD-(D/E)XK nuclease family protein [Desulfuromonas sp. AOP6]BCA79780.1 ATP-dependent helicase [Desulfuromonas sp. AOP6]